MTLKSLHIHGFRGFKTSGKINFGLPENEKPGSGLTIITGPNNSGKSSIIECLRARNGHQTPSFSVGARNSSAEIVEIELEFMAGKELITSLHKGSSESKRSAKLSKSTIFALSSKRSFNPYFGRHTQDREAFISNQGGLQATRSFFIQGFESRLFSILGNADKKSSFDHILSEVLGFTPQWSIDLLEQGQHFLKFFSANHSHSSDGMGEGIVSIFVIVDAIYDSSPGDIIVIDEPELSLHPSLQKRLAKLLCRMSMDRQIIFATHSPYFVSIDSLQNGAELVRVVTGDEGTKIFQLSRNSINAISAISIGNRFNPHVFGLDACELFFQEDGIVLTEGQEDVLVLPEIARQLEEIIPGSFFGWGAGGAGNFKSLLHVFSDLGFAKVAAILDGNMSDKTQELSKLFPNYHICAIPADDIRTKKAVRPKRETIGILDADWKVRSRFAADMKRTLAGIRDYIQPPKDVQVAQ